MSAFTQGNDGQRGLPAGDSAPGGLSNAFGELGCNGGSGSSAVEINGGDNVCSPTDDDGGGGGGGAGRIRINGTAVHFEESALSPAPTTLATTIGPFPGS